MEPIDKHIAIEPLTEILDNLKERIGQVIVGQDTMVELLLAGLLADGHILIEGVPGVAKTLTAKLMARLIDASFSRLQFTPDLMPSDVIGTNVFNPQSASFQFKPGPVFANMVLIDEINRAPAKTQSALFEVMEERQVTIDGTTHTMQPPFMVIATQNPIEHEGTYRLPEAQLDRFLMKIIVGYPSMEQEVSILTLHDQGSDHDRLASLQPIISREVLKVARQQIRRVHAEPRLIDLIARIVWETRNDRALFIGASPRASIATLQVAKAVAVIRGRDFIIPEDIVFAAPHVLRHRILLTPEKEMEGATPDDAIRDIISRIEIPR